MLQSEVVKALAAIASKGTYKIGPADARHMNTVFEEVAALINELELQEKLTYELATQNKLVA